MSTNAALNIALRRAAAKKKTVTTIPAVPSAPSAGNSQPAPSVTTTQSVQPKAALAQPADIATIDAEIARSRARWAGVLVTQPTIAQTWAAWRSAGNLPEGLTTIAETAIAARVPFAEGQPFDAAPWRAWASGASAGTTPPSAGNVPPQPAADSDGEWWQFTLGQEAEALALGEQA